MCAPIMTDVPTRFGIPNTLPPLGYGALRGCFWFGGVGFLLLLLGLFHNAIPFRVALVCWLMLPFLGFLLVGEFCSAACCQRVSFIGSCVTTRAEFRTDRILQNTLSDFAPVGY